MESEKPINPHLADLFRSAIEQAKPPASEAPPQIVVHGSGNVFSWGGTVHISEVRPTGVGEQE